MFMLNFVVEFLSFYETKKRFNTVKFPPLTSVSSAAFRRRGGRTLGLVGGGADVVGEVHVGVPGEREVAGRRLR